MVQEDAFYVEDECVVSMFIGEIGWGLQRWFGFLRYLKHKVYQDKKFLVMTDLNLHPFIADFTAYTLGLPKEFHALGLDRDCYESVIPDSPPASLTPSNVYAGLLKYIRQFYDPDKSIEVWTPRGCNTWVDNKLQVFYRYKIAPIIESDRPIVVVLPRYRVRASVRNVPPYVWKDVVDILRKEFLVVLAGTPSGTCLHDYEGENIVNLIKYDKEDKSEKIIQYLNSALISVSSQSGGTHVSLLSGCSSYIIGHEKERHTQIENRLDVPTSFRYVQDYRAIDANTIISDIKGFIEALHKEGWIQSSDKSPTIYSYIIDNDKKILKKYLEEN